MRDPFPAWSGKNSRLSRRISRGGALNRKVERNSRGPATIPKVPQMSQSTPEEPDFPALPRHSCRGSTHTTAACVTALWESLVGKPQGKATDPCINAKGSLTLLLQLGGNWTCIFAVETRTGLPVDTPEVPQDPCQHWRGILRFRPRLQTRS